MLIGSHRCPVNTDEGYLGGVRLGWQNTLTHGYFYRISYVDNDFDSFAVITGSWLPMSRDGLGDHF